MSPGQAPGPSSFRNGELRKPRYEVLAGERSDKGMPSAEKMGIDSVYFTGLYDYLKGRSEGRYHGGRPARRE